MPKPPRLRISKPTSALPCSQLAMADLTDVGSRFRLDLLVEHAEKLLPKLGKYGFARFGFGPAWVAAIGDLVGELEAAGESVQAAKDDALPSGTELDAAVAAAKAWRRDALTVVHLVPKLAAKRPHITGSSLAHLTASMRALLPLAGSAAAEGAGGGAEMKAQGAELLATLQAASKQHGAALGKLSPERRALAAKKGLLYEELKRLSRAARNVAPNESSLFAVSTHLRAHRGRRKSGASQAKAAVG